MEEMEKMETQENNKRSEARHSGDDLAIMVKQ
jgi:hypothetical protein